jgi:glycosyltransferase involved in cell wall biosynthesis
MKTLSILIPTRNRYSALLVTLEGLLRYADNSVEIIVSDNCSDTIAHEFLDTHVVNHGLVFQRQPYNIGLAANLLYLIGRASGSHLILFGDDDAPRVDLIPLLLRHIKQDKPLVSKLPFEYCHTNELLKPFEVESDFCDNETFFLQDFNDTVMPSFEEKAGFITSHLFDRKHLVEVLDQIRTLPKASQVLNNVYLTKLYTMMATKKAGGFWTYPSTLLHQRIPSGAGRNFFSTPEETYNTMLVSPAICYAALRGSDPEFAEVLLSHHFSKAGNFGMLRKAGISRWRMIWLLCRYRPRLPRYTYLRIIKSLFSRSAG